MKLEKSWKREAALALMAYTCFLLWVGIDNPGAADAGGKLLPFSFAFMFGAFGMDAYAKQVLPQRTPGP